MVLGHSTSEARAGPVFSKHYQFAAETVFCCQEISNSVQLWINFTGNCSLILTATGCFDRNDSVAATATVSNPGPFLLKHPVPTAASKAT